MVNRGVSRRARRVETVSRSQMTNAAQTQSAKTCHAIGDTSNTPTCSNARLRPMRALCFGVPLVASPGIAWSDAALTSPRLAPL
jgi:hypothetical protein